MLAAVTGLIYAGDAFALGCGVVISTPGTNPTWVLAVLALVALALAAYALLVRGRRLTRTEAASMLCVHLVAVAGMSHTTGLDLAALGNGLSLGLLGAYVSWLLAGSTAARLGYYAGLVLWLAAIAGRENGYLTLAAVLVVAQAGVCTEIVRVMRRRIQRLTDHDPLTGLLNRRAIEVVAHHLLDRVARQRTAASVAILDLDDLRGINNTHGHLAGDDLLVAVAEEWRDAFRHAPISIGRIGGDEFVMLFEDVDEDEARSLLTDLHGTSQVRWTAGVAQVRPGEPFNSALARADDDMYAHKQQDRSGATSQVKIA